MKRIYLKPGKAKPFWYGHPWVFSNAIASLDAGLSAGEEVELCTQKKQILGQGFYNPNSQIRVRLYTGPHELLGPLFWKEKILQAINLRRNTLKLPTKETNIYRLINSEGDGLSGLTVDCFDKVLVVQFSSLGLYQRSQLIFDTLEELIQPLAIIETVTPAVQKLEGFSVEAGIRRGSLDSFSLQKVSAKENGITYSILVDNNQKTGFFCDQRENRKRVEKFAANKRVLDAYCFNGGFALHCLQGGAKEVTLVDSSQKALSLAEENLTQNRFSARLIASDVSRFLTSQKEKFDLIILDPPKFVQRAKDKRKGLGKYRYINTLALKRIEAGGMLVSCSCSGLVSKDEFLRMLGEAAFEANRRISILSMHGAGPDHPIRLPCVESHYLKCIIAQVF